MEINDVAEKMLEENGMDKKALELYGIEMFDDEEDDDEEEDATSEDSYKKERIDLGLGTAEQQALNIRTLSTHIRTVEGTRACTTLREQFRLIRFSSRFLCEVVYAN